MRSIAYTSIGIVAFILGGSLAGISQSVKSGKVIYEETVKLEIHLGGDAAALAANLPKETKSNKVLLFNENASLYTNQKVEDHVENQMASAAGEGVSMRFMMSQPENKMFTDFAANKQTEQREFMTRMFLIDKQLGVSDWKLTGNGKDILGYPCQEAVRQINDSTQVTAWFAPSIPVPSGPAEYLNLPGLVLGVDLDKGSRTLIATAFEPREVDARELAKPKDGKKVTEEEFKKIVEEKMKEMGVEMGPGGPGGRRVMIHVTK